MIDFRYHVVSIVAVLFALAIGIIFGSGFLGGALLNRLDTALDDLDRRNQELLRDLRELRQFADESERPLVQGALQGRDVLVFTAEGTDTATVDGVRDAIGIAGGAVIGTVEATTRLELEDPDERALLAEMLASDATGADALRRDTARLLAARAVAAASFSFDRPRIGPTADGRLLEMLEDFGAENFLQTDGFDEADPTVPPGSMFVIVAGNADPAPLGWRGFVTALATNLAVRDVTVLVAEPSASAWGIVDSICDDAADRVSTVNQADTVPGRVGVVLTLKAGPAVGHHGVGACAEDGIIPAPEQAG
ncbi:MAG: copper transporter [Actinomycetota bacterium]